MRKQNKEKTITLRVTSSEFNKIKLKAGLYCDGNISQWIATCSLNYTPDKKDFKKAKA